MQVIIIFYTFYAIIIHFVSISFSFIYSYFNALLLVTTLSPISFSKSFLALPAILPPRLATSTFSFKPLGFFFLAISLVAISPKSAKATYTSVILSLNDSFLSPLYFLYSWAVIPDHSL